MGIARSALPATSVDQVVLLMRPRAAMPLPLAAKCSTHRKLFTPTEWIFRDLMCLNRSACRAVFVSGQIATNDLFRPLNAA